MAAGAGNGAGKMASILALPPELLERIYSVLYDPDDRARYRLVDTRFCAAARAALTSAEPHHPGFLELALQHSYPLRHLSTADLPCCDLKSYLAKAPSSLTSLLVAERTLTSERDMEPMASVLQGICTLRSLSCPVLQDTLDFLQPHLAGLHTLSLKLAEETNDYQALLHLANLTRLRLTISESPAKACQLASVVATLTTLRSLWLPTLADSPTLLPLSTLRNLTSLRLGSLGHDSDAGTAALAQALPQLRALGLYGCGNVATDAGLCQLSNLRQLQHLALVWSFESCTHQGLDAALATMTGLEALEVTHSSFLTEQGLAIIARSTSLTALFVDELPPIPSISRAFDTMLEALGSRLEQLSVTYAYAHGGPEPRKPDSLLPAILMRCPRLRQLSFDPVDQDLDDTVMADKKLTCCSQLFLACYDKADLFLPSFQEVRHLHVTVAAYGDGAAPLTHGLRCLSLLESLTVELAVCVAVGTPLLGILEGFGIAHLQALAALPQLTVLNLHHLRWEDDATGLGLAWLTIRLPRLRVLNAPDTVLDREVAGHRLLHGRDGACSYKLQGLPGRWLRRWPCPDRWPRRATCDVDEDNPAHELWPVLQPHRWLWDD